MGVQTHEKIFTNPFSKWLLVGYIPILEFGTIPIRKKKLISGDEDIHFSWKDKNG
jgi:hypothetical protein